MDWNKAKNLIIMFLIGLNAILLGLIYIYTPQYVLTGERETAVLNVLHANNMTLQTSIPRRYGPMPQLQMQPANYDLSALGRFFFGEGAALTHDIENERMVMTDDQGRTLTIFNDGFVLFDGLFLSSDAVDMHDIRSICDSLITQNADLAPGFIFDYPNQNGIQTAGGTRFEYRQRFKQQSVYSNFMSFTVTEAGIVQITYHFKKAIGFESAKREIIPPDAALFAFMRYFIELYGTGTAVAINAMDIVYYQEELSEGGVSAYSAAPFYRFWVAGMEMPFLINAHTGLWRSDL